MATKFQLFRTPSPKQANPLPLQVETKAFGFFYDSEKVAQRGVGGK